MFLLLLLLYYYTSYRRSVTMLDVSRFGVNKKNGHTRSVIGTARTYSLERVV